MPQRKEQPIMCPECGEFLRKVAPLTYACVNLNCSVRFVRLHWSGSGRIVKIIRASKQTMQRIRREWK